MPALRCCFQCEQRLDDAIRHASGTCLTYVCPHRRVVVSVELDNGEPVRWHLNGYRDALEFQVVLIDGSALSPERIAQLR